MAKQLEDDKLRLGIRDSGFGMADWCFIKGAGTEVPVEDDVDSTDDDDDENDAKMQRCCYCCCC